MTYLPRIGYAPSHLCTLLPVAIYRNMPKRPSSVAVLAVVVLAGITVRITHQAKALEQDLDVNSQKIGSSVSPHPSWW